MNAHKTIYWGWVQTKHHNKDISMHFKSLLKKRGNKFENPCVLAGAVLHNKYIIVKKSNASTRSTIHCMFNNHVGFINELYQITQSQNQINLN